MCLTSLLATLTLISLANAAPMIQPTDHRAKIPLDNDHFLLILLLNRKDLGMKTKPMDETGGDYIVVSPDSPELLEPSRDNSRDKRIGSLSVVNSVDVLRERVLLELARRKAMEDQGLFGRNRELVSSVGKRTFPYQDHRIGRKKRLQYVIEPQ
ncbi:diuretic hormone 44 [Phymastichus coffea]|uniref:diuretic hormone 44 n=1 Tax=Phymastichus coffea TaxID=108790 RepID=UPI00273B8642|nr:diuretic hormone 44 [Phymastichus coffea]